MVDTPSTQGGTVSTAGGEALSHVLISLRRLLCTKVVLCLGHWGHTYIHTYIHCIHIDTAAGSRGKLTLLLDLCLWEVQKQAGYDPAAGSSIYVTMYVCMHVS